jgi:hypothetical protein
MFQAVFAAPDDPPSWRASLTSWRAIDRAWGALVRQGGQRLDSPGLARTLFHRQRADQKYFNYRYEGLRAIRALRDIVQCQHGDANILTTC